MPMIGPDDAARHPGQVGAASPLLFAGLIDDAAMFPPGNAPLDRAAREHELHRSAWYADVIGPLLVPAPLLPELSRYVDRAAWTASLPLGLIGADGPDQLLAALPHASPATPVVAAELPLASTPDLLGDWERLTGSMAHDPITYDPMTHDTMTHDTMAIWWELDRRADLRPQLDRLSGPARRFERGGAKLRMAGPSDADWPAEPAVASFIRHAIDIDVTFKLTAGLHHAVRCTDASTGLEQHGVLNVLCAVKAALNGAEEGELGDLLAQRDPAPLVERTNAMSVADASVIRAFWASFGCCGVTDPVDELAALGLL